MTVSWGTKPDWSHRGLAKDVSKECATVRAEGMSSVHVNLLSRSMKTRLGRLALNASLNTSETAAAGVNERVR